MARSFAVLLFASLLVVGAIRDTQAARFLIDTIGDSITSGYPYYLPIEGNGCTPPCGGYQPKLQSLLLAAGKDVLVRNYGVRGASTADGVARIDALLDSSSPQFVLILEGTNDLLFLSKDTVYKNIAYMVDATLARGEVPILGTLPPDIRNGEEYINKPIVETNTLLQQLARDRNIALADHYSALVGNWANLTYEGLHPNLAGYEVMARTWFTPVHAKITAMTSLPWLMLLLD
ncbi:MAG: GDSL-type esterase/lipase family protein [Desulfobulbus sp.]|jgi:acyl-CoA thioesterase-1|nr:GDSL-type esterase/lipase family protein [Desulfobulbus sp.]